MSGVKLRAQATNAVHRPPRWTAFSFAALLMLALPVRAGVPAGVPIARLKTTVREVALSFDDGPQAGPVLDTLLAVLAARHAHATFFVIGSELAAHPEIAARLLAAGHELGNHTWTHPHLDSLPMDSVRIQLARTDSLLRALGVKGRILVRPPFGALSDAVVAELKRRHRVVPLFDVDPSYDFPGMAAPDSIVDKTLLWLGPGSILVVHPWYGNDGPALAILPGILERLERFGYRVVTISELLKIKHAVVEPSLYHVVE
jgi:peptidoglycan/xylan/chitin deacetylase (PgdA/CDA1 family)